MMSLGPRTTGVPLRSPGQVMRLERLGSFHQCRLSFMRVLTRRMGRENWRFSRGVFDIDENGVGRSVHSVRATGGRTYSLVSFAHDLPDELRSDRVIAEAWDTTFALFDGIPTTRDLDRLEDNVPFQEAGRLTEQELVLSRANRSVRLWRHVVDSLAAGGQPDPGKIERVGYLMRTTAVYASGKFGTADRDVVRGRPEMQLPFQAEMLTVYLIRTFVRDLVNHLARSRSGSQGARLDDRVAQRLGIGNSTGLGMAPFIVNHPVLYNNWITARERAIAAVRSVHAATENEIAVFRGLVERSSRQVRLWISVHPMQRAKITDLRRDLDALTGYLDTLDLGDEFPWDRLVLWSETELSVEGQELVASLILEPYPGLVDQLAESMEDRNLDSGDIDGSMTVGQVRQLIAGQFGWAFETDWQSPESIARVWYVSEEKLEPRLGERFEEPLEMYEQPIATARDAVCTYNALSGWPDDRIIAGFLLEHPDHRHVIRRVQRCRAAQYCEIRDNLVSAELLPIDMLRSKLAFFGATNFDPRSDRWVRICMFAGAPYPEDLGTRDSDTWIYPVPEPGSAIAP